MQTNSLGEERGVALPREAYFDRDWYDREMATVFSTSWVLGAYSDDLPEPRDYVTARVGTEEVILVRTATNEIKAYANVCRHRCMPLVDGAGRLEGTRFKCAYHAWEYDIGDGSLRKVPKETEFTDLQPTSLALIPVAIHETRGLIFLNAHPAPSDFGSFADEYESHVSSVDYSGLKCVFRTQVRLQCNWKLLVENHVDVLHLWYLHPRSLAMYDHAEFESTQCGPHWVSREQLRPTGREALDLDRRGLPDLPGISDDERATQRANFFFPSVLETSSCTRVCTYQLHPVGPEETDLEIRVRATPGSELTEYGVERLLKVLIDEDGRSMERLQRAVRSQHYAPAVSALRFESGITAFHEALVKAMQTTNSLSGRDDTDNGVNLPMHLVEPSVLHD